MSKNTFVINGGFFWALSCNTVGLKENGGFLGGSVPQFKLLEKLKDFGGSARMSGALSVSERECERRSRKFLRARAALIFFASH